MKVYSRINELPSGKASDTITGGCLVLEGGAFRGVYTSGVIDALMINDINLECTAGVSAGAMNGINYAAGEIGRSGKINLSLRHNKRYVGIAPLLHDKGIIGFDFVFNGILDKFPFDLNGFLHSPRRFVAAATNCLTGKPEYFEKDCGNIFKAIQASASMPLLSKMVYIDGVPYLDGGCSSKIPLDWALEQGYEKIVLVRSRERSFRRGAESEKIKRLKRRFYSKYPELLSALLEECERYNALCDRIDELEKAGRIFVIAPSEPVTVGRLERDMEKLGALYQLGYKDGERLIPDITAYLK